jgi:transcription initiation factor TFIIF subunit beta
MKQRTKNATSGPRPQQQKFARMPENELFDKLYQCFREFKYWPMKAFRAKLQQPESYLKETLDKIAVLGKSGRFASMWSLKPENLEIASATSDSLAPAGMEGLGDEDSDMADAEDADDEDVKFEDVVS